MTNEQDRKAVIRAYADAYGINYTTALREISRDNLWWERRGALWAEERGLVRNHDTVCFHRLASEHGVEAPRWWNGMHENCRIISGTRYDGILDHVRLYDYRAPGARRRRPAVVTMFPYLDDGPEERASVAALADEHDLAWRIGQERDRGYGHDTLPIVVWNPRVIDLS